MSAQDLGPTDGERESRAKIFISYSRKDMAFADRLDAALKARGFDPLIDRSEIYALEDWWKRIEALISRADTIVFVLSPDAIASETCAKEVQSPGRTAIFVSARPGEKNRGQCRDGQER